MKKQFLITVETLSDIMPGSGESMPGVADNDSRYDEYGLPYMNAKTIKGHLREQMRLIKSVAPRYRDVNIESLLGETDLYSSKAAARIKVSSLTVAPAIRDRVADAVRSNTVTAEEISYALSRICSQTRIGEDGVAADGSLRQLREIRKGLQFVARLEVDVPTDPEQASLEQAFLEQSVNAIQHIGTGKSKGKGVVRCTLTDMGAVTIDDVPVTGSGETIIYRLHVVEPIKVGGGGSQNNTESLSYIPGSMMRGTLISSLNKAIGGSQLDSVLCGARFSDATLVADGRPLFTCPPIYYATKHERREAQRTGKNLTANIRIPVSNENMGYPEIGEQSIGKGQYASTANGLSLCNVRKIANVHIAVEREDADDEQRMYRYEAIAPGQIYEGVIRCATSDIANLIVQALSDKTIYVGGSRGTGYGRCEVLCISRTNQIGEAQRLGLRRKTDSNILTIYALSNLLLLGKDGQETGEIDPTFLASALGISDVRLLRSNVTIHYATGYNHKWRAGQVQRSAVAAGSIYYYTYTGTMQEDKAAALEERGIGLRREDGYGNILVSPDFLAGSEGTVTVQNLCPDGVQAEPQTLDEKDMNTLSYIENRINAYREDLFMREAALAIADKSKNSIKPMTMTQRTRLYSLFGQILDCDANARNVEEATGQIQAFMANLKERAGTMYHNAGLVIDGNKISMIDLVNSRLCDCRYELHDLTGAWAQDGHETQVTYLHLLHNVTRSDEDVFYDKLRFLYLVLYDLMRGEA